MNEITESDTVHLVSEGVLDSKSFCFDVQSAVVHSDLLFQLFIVISVVTSALYKTIKML